MAERAKIRIATCRDGAEAALVRALLGGHGIHAHVAGEHHAALLGGLAGGFIPLDVWVDVEDAEPAAELLRSMREEGRADELDDGAPEPDAGDFDRDLDGDLDAAMDPRLAIERRKRTGIVLLLSCVVTFGTGHLYVGAWGRALALMAIELYGFLQLGHQPALGFAMIAGAVITDAVGATIRARRDPSSLPRAQLRS